MVIRDKYWIDRDVQGILIGRVIVYLLAAAVYLLLGNFCFSYWREPDWTLDQHASYLFQQLWPWLPSMLLLIPLVMHDVVRVSNLFAGPIFRLRKHLAELNRDPNCRPLKFRDDDFWQDLVAPINQLQNENLALRHVVDGLVKKQALVDEPAAGAPSPGDSSSLATALSTASRGDFERWASDRWASDRWASDRSSGSRQFAEPRS